MHLSAIIAYYGCSHNTVTQQILKTLTSWRIWSSFSPPEEPAAWGLLQW